MAKIKIVKKTKCPRCGRILKGDGENLKCLGCDVYWYINGEQMKRWTGRRWVIMSEEYAQRRGIVWQR